MVRGGNSRRADAAIIFMACASKPVALEDEAPALYCPADWRGNADNDLDLDIVPREEEATASRPLNGDGVLDLEVAALLVGV